MSQVTKQVNAWRILLNNTAFLCLLIMYSTTTLAAVETNNVSLPFTKNIQSQWGNSKLTTGISGLDKNDKLINRFIVKYRSGLDRSVRNNIVRQYSLQTVKKYKSLPDVDVVVINNDDPSSILKKFKLDPNVAYVERDQAIQLLSMPNDLQLSALWSLNNSLDTDLNAAEAWDISVGNRDNVLAVIDTGVAYRHVDLSDNMWRNPNEIPGNGIDDDNNGYIDDIYGIDPSEDDTDPLDEYGHGTHVAGTIAATGNNGKGVSGINQVGSILACKIFGNNILGFQSMVSVAIECLDYIWNLKVNQGVNIIASNASWGWTGKSSQAMYDALVKHRDAGILFVAAAGNSRLDNDTLLDFPASYDLANVIAVAAGNVHDEQTYFSSYGKHSVHLTAPGENIYSTVPSSFVIPTVPSDVFFDNLENGLSNWIADPEWGESAESHSGTVAWSDSPDGNYANKADTSLQSIVMDLSPHIGQQLNLSFVVNHELESNFDILHVETSTDNGVTWESAGELTGRSNGWLFKSVPITASAQFAFRFRLTTDSSVSLDGVFIDDISIYTGAPVIVPDDLYAYFSGTSMAAPHVVGALGLLKSQNITNDWRHLKNLIIAGGVPFDTANQPTISNRRLRLTDIDGHGSMSCINQHVQARLRPTQNVIDIVNDSDSSINLSYMNINCAQPAGNVTVSVRETGQKITLLDDGQGIDQVAGDGIYSSVAALTNFNSAEVSIDFPNGDVLKVRLNPNYVVSTPTYTEINLNAPEKIDIPSNGFSVIVPPFPLQYFGNAYELAYVYEDGMLGFTFPRLTQIPYYYNLQLPTRGYEALIAPLWNHFETLYGQVVSQTLGVAPDRQFVIEWQNVNVIVDTSQDGATFQLVFYENSQDIRVNYKDVTFGSRPSSSEGAAATIGLQASSTLGMMYSYEEPVITDQSSLLWQYIPATNPIINKPAAGGTGGSGGGGGGLLWLMLTLLSFAWRKQARY